ncbi:ABC transporter permease [Hylemonella gracilis]|uniref:Inner-membrane translocator n=1 Tax=Hylemonella gracilis ATCC 19624 TaxID=887062 RepID=F3KPP1_9BURK|nr:ABC transporter permease [Hylemonella gracilis]EGI78299.1 inner-membrane translocator [Hylemonella gracilis ATCC 19624]
MSWRTSLLIRLRPSPVLLVSAVAVLLAFGVGALLIALMGVPVGEAVAAFADGAWGSPYALAASLNRALVFMLVGLGFILAERASLTNVGGEGQIAVGGITATAFALWAPVAALPWGLSFVVPLLGACLAGALWGGIAGVLKVKAGTNEVIATLLLSFIAIWMVYGSVQSESLLRRPMTSSATLPESLEIPEATQLPLLTGDASMPLHAGLLLGLVLALVVAVILRRTVLGLQLRATGLNPRAARRAGMPIERLTIGVLCAAGAFGGLAGACMLQGEQYTLKAGFSSGYGFDGLVVGLLARGSMPGVIAGALLFGFLRSGGINMEMVAQVPTALVVVIQGLIIVTLAGAALGIQRMEARTP